MPQGSSKSVLSRTMDVYDLQELADDPDPHATLPFISHHTLILSRDLDEPGGKSNGERDSKGFKNPWDIGH